MYSAVNAPRHGLHSLFHSLRKVLVTVFFFHRERGGRCGERKRLAVHFHPFNPLFVDFFLQLLSYIHQQRSQKSVSEMLSRLYNPFLWRSLKVANVYVRANAATLFLDAFPLQDPDSSREEMDAVMQKQFDAMTVRTD